MKELVSATTTPAPSSTPSPAASIYINIRDHFLQALIEPYTNSLDTSCNLLDKNNMLRTNRIKSKNSTFQAAEPMEMYKLQAQGEKAKKKNMKNKPPPWSRGDCGGRDIYKTKQ